MPRPGPTQPPIVRPSPAPAPPTPTPTPQPLPVPPVIPPSLEDGSSPEVVEEQTEEGAEEDRTTDDEPECENCEDCVARRWGSSIASPAPQERYAHKVGYDYQHYICPWHWYAPDQALIEEWQFSGPKFDGIHPEKCQLFEAKHGYDGFLEASYTPTERWPHGRPILKEWAAKSGVWNNTFEPIIKQAKRQFTAVYPHFEVDLAWVFSEQITSTYVMMEIYQAGVDWSYDWEVRPFVR